MRYFILHSQVVGIETLSSTIRIDDGFRVTPYRTYASKKEAVKEVQAEQETALAHKKDLLRRLQQEIGVLEAEIKEPSQKGP